jgi:hypothetical protein
MRRSCLIVHMSYLKNHSTEFDEIWYSAYTSITKLLTPYSVWNPYLTGHIALQQEAEIAQWYSAGLWAGWSRVRVPEEAGNFFFTTASRSAMGPNQPPTQWVPGALSLGVKRPGPEADHSPPPRSRMCEAIPPLPHYAFKAWCSVKKHRNNFTFTLLLYNGSWYKH